MNPVSDSLKPEERVLYALRSLYQRYGYSQFKMSKFEEYDLYVRNKDFLVSDGVITFTDTDGRLMALKPDVTLSIIKNTRQMPGNLQKLYYNENVYRVSGSTRCFKEIMQTGLECIGDVDLYSLCEVISLAAQSLSAIDPNYVLDLSHMGVVSALVDALELDAKRRSQVLACIGDKNGDGVRRLCPDRDVSGILALISAHGSAEAVIATLRPWCTGGEAKAALVALDKETGKRAWARGMDSRCESSPVAVYDKDGNGWIIQCMENGTVELLEGLTGKPVATLQVEGQIEASPAVYGDMMVVGTTGKGTSYIYGIRVWDGTEPAEEEAEAGKIPAQEEEPGEEPAENGEENWDEEGNWDEEDGEEDAEGAEDEEVSGGA